MLIGAGYYWSLVTEGIIRLDHSLVAIRSKLGYMLSGPLKLYEEKQLISHVTNCVRVMKISDTLDGDFVIRNDNIDNDNDFGNWIL